MEINQFISGIAFGDAVSNDALMIQKMLLELGYGSKIFVEFSDDSTNDFVHSINEYEGSEDSILIIHHSLYIQNVDKVTTLPDKKILRYHNITPAAFFAKDSYMSNVIHKGMAQTRALEKHCCIAFGDSRYNEIELRKQGYFNTREFPIAIDFEKYDKNAKVSDRWNAVMKDSFNVISIGRVVENKNQHLIAEAFYEFSKTYGKKANLFLIGDNSNRTSYVQKVQSFIDKKKAGNIYMTGKIADEEMMGFYNQASCLIIFSDHEGFCVPLVEAMQYSLPIIAKNTSAIPYTLDGAGILVETKEEAIKALTQLTGDIHYKAEILKGQNERLAFFSESNNKAILKRLLAEVIHGSYAKKVQIKGPFETSYSLALVNKEFASNIAADTTFDVSIYASEGHGDYTPFESDIRKLDVKSKYLWEKSFVPFAPWLEIRNMWPPRVNDFTSLYKTFYFAWEESRVPATIIDDFNNHLDCLFVTSSSTKLAVEESGLQIPAYIIGESIKTEGIKPTTGKSSATINFLHISSCFPRKGVDKLIQAYCETFSGAKDTCLIIKTFANAHNNVEALIKKNASKGSPKIELIMEDLPEEEIEALYAKSHIYLSPSRGEGFNRPVAEAMLRGLPAVVTGWGGHMDFCNEQNAFVVKYSLEKSRSHIENKESCWAEPYTEDLKRQMRNAYQLVKTGGQEYEKLLDIARSSILQKCSEEVIQSNFQEKLSLLKAQKKMKIGHLTTWGIKCGIANYTYDLIHADNSSDVENIVFANHASDTLYEDKANVVRCWYQNNTPESTLDALYKNIIANNIDCLHIQFNFGFYNIMNLSELIRHITAKGVKVVITFHSTDKVFHQNEWLSIDQFAPVAHLVSIVYCFKEDDYYVLPFTFSKSTIKMIPHGLNGFPPISNEEMATARKNLGIENDFVISTHGFMLPHKGIDLILEAMILLNKKGVKNIKFLSVTSWHNDSEASKTAFDTIKKIVSEHDLKEQFVLVDDFLDQVEIYKLLSLSDLIIFPYKPTKESASGAIRNAILTNIPVLTSDQPIFNDITEFSSRFKSTVEELVAAIEAFYVNRNKDKDKLSLRKEYIERNSWDKLSQATISDIREIVF